MRSELNIPALTIESTQQDGAQVVTLGGELDLRGVGEVETALAAAAESGRVCLDLSDLQFIDSTGLATVIRAHQTLTGAGGRLAVVCRADGSVRRAFETTGLTTLLTVTGDRGAALQALS